MAKFKDEQIKRLNERASQIAQNISDEKSTEDIVAEVYADAFEDKTVEQGRLIANSIVNSVRNFDIDYADAKVDVDHFIRKFQKGIDNGKSCYERCVYWRNFALAVTAATIKMNDNDSEIDRIVRELEGINLTEEEADENYEEKLRMLAFDAIKSSNILTETLAIHSNELQSVSDADEAAQLLIDLGNEDVDYRSIVSMLVYIDTINGEYPDIPVDMTAGQIATLVCTEIEQIKIIDALERGDITFTIANSLLYILGVVAILEVTAAAAATAIAVVLSSFGTILAVPACLVAIAGILHLMFGGIKLWEKDSRKIMITVVKTARSIATAGRKLFSYMKDVLVPGMIDSCKHRFDKLKNKNPDTNEEIVINTDTVTA